MGLPKRIIGQGDPRARAGNPIVECREQPDRSSSRHPHRPMSSEAPASRVPALETPSPSGHNRYHILGRSPSADANLVFTLEIPQDVNLNMNQVRERINNHMHQAVERLEALLPAMLGGNPDTPADPEAVAALPQSVLSTVESERHGSCTVCLAEFEAGDEVLEMPCKHVFHKNCLLPWLNKKPSCPLCRNSLPSQSNPDQIQQGEALQNLYVAALSSTMAGIIPAILQDSAAAPSAVVPSAVPHQLDALEPLSRTSSQPASNVALTTPSQPASNVALTTPSQPASNV